MYISVDKQIIRNVAIEFGWIEKAEKLSKGEILEVNVSDEVTDRVISGYTSIYRALAA